MPPVTLETTQMPYFFLLLMVMPGILAVTVAIVAPITRFLIGG